MENIPAELLCHIVSYADAQSFLCARGVCKRWRNILDCSSNVSWSRVCLGLEMTKEFIVDVVHSYPSIVLSSHYNSEGSTEDILKSVDCKHLYEIWNVWKTIGKRSEITESIKLDPLMECSKIRITGELAFTGHRNGFVCLWTQGFGLAQWVFHTTMAIMDVLLVNSQGLDEYECNKERWVSEHDVVVAVTRCQVAMLDVTDSHHQLYTQQFSEYITAATCCGGRIALALSSREVVVYEVLERQVVGEWRYWLPISINPEDYISAICLSNELMHVAVSSGVVYSFDLMKAGLTGSLDILSRDYVPPITWGNFKQRYRCNLFRGNIFIFVDVFSPNFLYGHFNDNKELLQTRYVHDRISVFNSRDIRCAFLGNLLAVGTCTGKIYIYRTEKNGILGMNFRRPLKTLHIGGSIVVLDILIGPEGHVIAGATPTRIFSIKWKEK